MFTAFPTGIALAHGTECYTAGPGYTNNCGFIAAIWHQDNDGLGNLAEQFRMAATFSQTSYGSFDWVSVTIMDSWQCGDCLTQYGPTWFYASSPYSSVSQASWWQCNNSLDYWQYDTRTWSQTHNPTIIGTWQQEIVYNGCGDPATSDHALNVNAY